MAYQIVVKVKGVKNDEIYSHEMDKEEAERQLAAIRDDLGTAGTPELPWLAVQGQNIVSAHMTEVTHHFGIG